MKTPVEEIIRYTIKSLDWDARTVKLRSSLPVATLRTARLQNFLFPKPPVTVGEIAADGNTGSRYTVCLADIPPEANFPPVYPSWHDGAFAIPLWCLLLLPAGDDDRVVQVQMHPSVSSGGRVHLICPTTPQNASAMSGFCLLGGYRQTDFTIKGCRVLLYCAHEDDKEYLKSSLQTVLATHYRVFGQWLWPRLHMIIEQQRPRLKKQKAMLFTDRDMACGRYVLRSMQPWERFERVTQVDILEHEILHYYIDTVAPAGSWLVEGLTTYLSRKLLFEAGVFDTSDWAALVTAALAECRRNPLCHTTSLNEATARYWDVRYGNVIYNKGFLVGCLLDRELVGGLLPLAKSLYRTKVRGGHQFSVADFTGRLPSTVRSKFKRLLQQRDLSAAFDRLQTPI